MTSTIAPESDEPDAVVESPVRARERIVVPATIVEMPGGLTAENAIPCRKCKHAPELHDFAYLPYVICKTLDCGAVGPYGATEHEAVWWWNEMMRVGIVAKVRRIFRWGAKP